MSHKNLPLLTFDNLFDEDHFGQKFWKSFLGVALFEKYRKDFELMGEAGAKATPLSEVADKQGPWLKNFNAVGERIDQVEYHPAHRELEELSFGNGIISKKYQSPLNDQEKSVRHLVGFSTAYYFAQTETGIFCPICMTDALGYVIEKHPGALPQVKKALKHIGSSDMKDLWQGAMFLTEKQGGSDVGANETKAVLEDGHWKLYGDKWFCSNVDAQVALALARLPGEEGDMKHGTKGLGLFLVLREDPVGNHRTWQVHRLKEKLGVRSMASGEVTFQGTEGYLLAGFNEGFKMMAEMVNMSRLYNSVASLAISRRALLEAKAFGENRNAFGAPLTRLPLWRGSFSDLAAEFVLLKTLVFETIRQLDRGETGDENAKRLSRILTPVCKALTGKFSVFSACECMELIGGNAYIEEHILPRLLRDAQVLPIWEGTTQIQSLDILRSLKKEGVAGLKERLGQTLKTEAEADLKDFVKTEQEQLFSMIAKVSTLSPEEMQRAARALLEQLGRAVGLSLVLELSGSADLKDIAQATLKRWKNRSHFCQSPASQYEGTLAHTEDVFIDAF